MLKQADNNKTRAIKQYTIFELTNLQPFNRISFTDLLCQRSDITENTNFCKLSITQCKTSTIESF